MNALVQIPSNGHEYRQSTDAAGLCGDIVKQTAKDIQGRKFVTCEGWQAIAIAHGCAASACNVERIEGGVRATGEVRRMSDGQLLASAEGFVGEDEAVWFGGTKKKWKWGQKRGEKVWYDEEMPKRPDYAIRAMAQTRAISRACRSAFAHVVVMIDAGLSTTPAEEVPDGGFVDGQFTEVRDEPQGDHAPRAENKPQTQRRQAATSEGMPAQDWEKLQRLIKATDSDEEKIKNHFGVKDLKRLTPKEYDQAVATLEETMAKMAREQSNRSGAQSGDIADDEIPY